MKLKSLAVLAAVCLLAGCARQPGATGEIKADSFADNTLIVRYDPSKYGDTWLKQAVAAFQQENPQAKVELTADQNIAATMAQALPTGRGLPDVALMPATNWQAYAEKGWLLKLDDLCETNVDGKTLQQRIVPGLAPFGQHQGSTWVLPLADSVSGLLYNAGMFVQNGWQPPATAQELLALLPQVKAKGIAPFSWAGKDQSFWSGAVNSWWGQLDGSAGIGAFLQMQSPAVYRSPGRLGALKLYEAIVTNSTNSVEKPESLDEEAAVEALFRGKAAMMPGQSWMLKRYKSILPGGVKIKMMRFPAPEGATAPNVEDATGGDFICIPAKATNTGLAKSFVLFLCKDSMSTLFYEETGTPSAFNGMPAETALQASSALSAASAAAQSAAAAQSTAAATAAQKPGVSAAHPASSAPSAAGEWDDPFAQSVYEIYTTSTLIRMYSQSPVYYNTFLSWPGTGEPFNAIYFGDMTAQQAFDAAALYAEQNWNAAGNVGSTPSAQPVIPSAPSSQTVSG